MKPRPITVTGIGVLLIAVGVLASAYHLHEVTLQHAHEGWNAGIFVVEGLAILSGVFLMRGKNWARWVAMAWIACHVVIGFLNSRSQVAFHFVIFFLIAYALFRADANAYFR